MTGTPLDLTPFSPLLSLLGALYWVLACFAIGVALWLSRSWPVKALAATLVATAFVYPVIHRMQAQLAQGDEGKKRLDASMALFNERCKGAGEKIHRTVGNVEGVFIMNQRSEQANLSDQFKMDDPYGYLGTGEDYIRVFLRGRAVRQLKICETARLNDLMTYQFVEVALDGDGQIFRYTTPMGKFQSETVTRNGGGIVPLERTSVLRRAARYGVEWTDISTVEDRRHWIAGGRLRIVDLATNEVIAERTGYMFDRGLGT